MKKIFKRALFGLPLFAFYFTFSFHAILISGCSTDSNRGGGGGGPLIISGAGDTSHYLHLQAGVIPAGSRLVLSCQSADCRGILNSGTPVTTGNAAGSNIIVVATIPYDIPENTELVLKVIPPGDPAKVDTAALRK
jgi:hypothetical protein